MKSPIVTSSLYHVVSQILYSVSQKNHPLRFSDNFFPNGWEFLINFYTPIIRSFLHQMTNFYSVISNFDEVMPY